MRIPQTQEAIGLALHGVCKEKAALLIKRSYMLSGCWRSFNLAASRGEAQGGKHRRVENHCGRGYSR
jgi:hypothetical protein